MGRPKQRMFSAPDLLPRGLRASFLVVDIGFLVYWTFIVFHLIPVNWLLKDYDQPVLLDWNWSFLPLNILVSVTGLLSLFMAARRSRKAVSLALLSLAFTFCSGLQALSFWSLRGDFNWMWWLPNLFLLLYPLPFLMTLINRNAR